MSALFRNVVIDLLRQNGLGAKLKKAEIFDAAKNTLKRDVTGNEYSKVSFHMVFIITFSVRNLIILSQTTQHTLTHGCTGKKWRGIKGIFIYFNQSHIIIVN